MTRAMVTMGVGMIALYAYVVTPLLAVATP